MSGVVSVLSQGCQGWQPNDNCLKQNCTHHGAPRIRHFKGKDVKYYFCCCNTDFCNRQFSLSSTVPGNGTRPPETSKWEYSRFQNSKDILSANKLPCGQKLQWRKSGGYQLKTQLD